MNSHLYDVAVIGAGGAGQMAALRAVLNHLYTVIFLGDATSARKSRATWVAEVENIPGFFDKKRPITATTRDVLKFIEGREDLKPFLTVVKATAKTIKKSDDLFELSDGKEDYRARFAVLASGTMDIQPEIQGSIEPIFPYANREDVLYCVRCDGHKVVGHDVAVIGDKSVAGWVAIILKERYGLEHLHVLTNGKEFDASEEVTKLLDQYQIRVLTDEIKEIHGNPREGLAGFQVGDHNLKVTKAFVSLGSLVYNDLAKQLGAQLNERDHVVTNEKGETTVAGFYAAGDLVAGKKKQVYTAWDMAVDSVDDIDLKIRKLKRAHQYTNV